MSVYLCIVHIYCQKEIIIIARVIHLFFCPSAHFRGAEAVATMTNIWPWGLLWLSFLTTQCTGNHDFPHVHGVCSSTAIDGGYSTFLRPDTMFHWKLSEDITSLEAVLEYDGEAWLAFGFSPTGQMIGSKVFLGEPANKQVTYNEILAQAVAGLERQNDLRLTNRSVTQTKGKTELSIKFTVTPGFPIWQRGAIPMIYALGHSNKLAYHEHRGSFLIDLKKCGGTHDIWKNDDYKSAFAIHGLFAILAMGLALPVGTAAAIFRTAIPRQWIYLHVSGQCLTFLLSLLAVVSAITGVAIKGGSHLTIGHHWVGLLLPVLIGCQLYSGIKRPPLKEVKMTDNLHAMGEESKNTNGPTVCCGLITLPTTRREKWRWLHRSLAANIVSTALFQIHSGLQLFAFQYDQNTGKILSVFWGYVIFIFLTLIMLRSIQALNDRQRRQAKEARRRARRLARRAQGMSNQSMSSDTTDEPDGEISEMSSINVI